MRPIAILQNSRNDGPGVFETFARELALPLRLYRRFAGDVLPADMTPFSALCLLGSPESANDDQPEIRQMEALIRESVARGLPVIGHCFGGQMLSRALGGKVTRAAHAEIGWSDIHGLDTTWFGAARFPMMQWHYETFSVPPGAMLIAQGELCGHQAFCVDDMHVGMQFHCEVDEAKLASWLDAEGCGEIAGGTSPGIQAPAQIRLRAHDALQVSTRVARCIYARWARRLTV